MKERDSGLRRKRIKKFETSFVVVIVYAGALATCAVAEAAAPQAPWSGWARCEINVSGQGYSDQQTHTWMISSSASAVSGAFRVYPATWSVVGSGSVQHTQGNQTLMAQWATSAQNLSAPLAVFVRASDGKMFIQARHTQAQAPHSVNGYQQQIIDGKPQKPGTIAAEAFEWTFPLVEVSRPKPGDPLVANGSSTPVVNGKVGFMQPAGTQASASCTWRFGQGSAAPAPPPAVAARATPTPPGSQGSAGSQNTGPQNGDQSTNTGGSCVGAPGNFADSLAMSPSVTFTWTAPATGTAISYVVEASSAPGGPANLANFNTGNSSTSLTVADVPAGTYYLRLRAVSGCGTGPPSAELQLVVPAGNASSCPSAPQHLTSSVSGNTVTLSWVAPSTGFTASYVIQAGSQAGMANLANFDTGNNTPSLVAQSVGAGSYYIRVYAKNNCGLSPASNEVLAVVQ